MVVAYSVIESSRAVLRYMMKKQIFDRGEPMFVTKELLMLLDDLITDLVLLRIILIIHISSSRRNDSRISINFVLLMIPKARDISISVIMIFSWNFWTYAPYFCTQLLHHTMSEVFFLDDKPFESERCSSTVGFILDNTIRLLMGPFGLPVSVNFVNQVLYVNLVHHVSVNQVLYEPLI